MALFYNKKDLTYFLKKLTLLFFIMSENSQFVLGNYTKLPSPPPLHIQSSFKDDIQNIQSLDELEYHIRKSINFSKIFIKCYGNRLMAYIYIDTKYYTIDLSKFYATILYSYEIKNGIREARCSLILISKDIDKFDKEEHVNFFNKFYYSTIVQRNTSFFNYILTNSEGYNKKCFFYRNEHNKILGAFHRLSLRVCKEMDISNTNYGFKSMKEFSQILINSYSKTRRYFDREAKELNDNIYININTYEERLIDILNSMKMKKSGV